MGRSVLKVKGYTSDQIKDLIKQDEKQILGIRLFAVFHVSLGKSSREVEEMFLVSFKQITNWVHRFEQGGIEGLMDRPGRGRKSSLSSAQTKELSELLLKGSPVDHGYNTETWTGPILIDWIRKHYGIEFKKAQIYNIIKQLGFTHQKGKGTYPEADENVQLEFKNDLKKTSRESC